MNGLTLILFVLGAVIALINIYYSVLCSLAHRLREGQWPATIPVGIPVAGTVLLLTSFVLAPTGSPLSFFAALLALLDTGGPLFFFALARSRRRHREQSEITAP